MQMKNSPALVKNSARVSAAQCEELARSFKIDDRRSDVITTGSAMIWQFWAHWVYDTRRIGNEIHNRYTGDADGMCGVYPKRGIDSPLITKDGHFLMEGDHLPMLRADGIVAETEMTPDPHRGNENPVLKAFHLAHARLHNKRMHVHDNYDRAVEECVALWNRAFLNEALLVCDMDEADFFNVRIHGLHNTVEGVMQVARWAHAQMPDTTNGLTLFRHQFSSRVDLPALFDGSEMARVLDLGVAPAMTMMFHTGEPDIRQRTLMSRHFESDLPTFGDLHTALGIGPTDDRKSSVPIWAGILMEAEEAGTGKLGRCGARAVADLIAGTLLWGRPEGKGVWRQPWKAAPSETVEIIDYAWN